MIKFIPLNENHNTGTLHSFRDNLDAIASANLAKQLNSKDIRTICADHPCEDSIVSVSIEGGLTFNIEKVCCEEFRGKLEEFLRKRDKDEQ